MAISIGDALLKIGVDTKDLDKGMKGIGASIKKHQKAIGLGMVAAGGAILAAGALSIKTFAEMGDEVQKMALRTGFSTEALSELRHAAEISGASLTTLEKAVKRMSGTILDAQDGLETYIRAFQHIGIEVEELDGLNPEQQFLKIAEAIAEVEDPTRRAALAQDIFGRAGTELLPLFASGKEGLAELREEAHRLGIVFDQEAANKAAALSDAMHRTEEAVMGVKMKIAEQLIPILIPLIDKVTAIITQFTAWAKEHPALTRVIVIGTAAFGVLLITLGMLLLLMPGLTAATAAFGITLSAAIWPVTLIALGIAALIAVGILLWKNWDTIKEKTIAIWGAIKNFFVSVWDKITDIFSKHWDKILAILFPAIGLPILIARNWDKIVKVISGIWNKVVENVENILGNLKDVIIDFGKNAIDWLRERLETLINPFKKIYDWISKLISGSGLEELTISFEHARKLAEKFGWAVVVQTYKIEAIKKAIDELTDSTKSYSVAAEQARRMMTAGEISRGIRGAAAEALAAGGWPTTVSGAGAAIISPAGYVDFIERGTAGTYEERLRWVIYQLRSALVPAGYIKSYFPRLAAFLEAQGVGFQRGGIAMRPIVARVAERTPEAIIPLDKLGGMLGDKKVNIFVELDGRVIARAIGQPLVDEIRLRTGMHI